MSIVETTALITVNETIWVQLLLFLFFLFVINRVMFRPVRRNLAERERHFDAIREDIRRLRGELVELVGRLEEDERRVRGEARRARRALFTEGLREAQKLVDKARAEIDGLRVQTDQRLSSAMAEARRHLEAEQRAVAAAILEAVLGRKVER
jgi:F-type H+-transporting ATPase subunit b